MSRGRCESIDARSYIRVLRGKDYPQSVHYGCAARIVDCLVDEVLFDILYKI